MLNGEVEYAPLEVLIIEAAYLFRSFAFFEGNHVG